LLNILTGCIQEKTGKQTDFAGQFHNKMGLECAAFWQSYKSVKKVLNVFAFSK
jgi:hypothetical protein